MDNYNIIAERERSTVVAQGLRVREAIRILSESTVNV